jgi:ABC-type Fe3+/spermidine/putrescine transport system ATPase subunit
MVVALAGRPISLAPLPGAAPGQRVWLFVRPSEVETLPVGAADDGNVLEGQVEKATYLGDRMDYRLALGAALTLRVQADARERWAPGAVVRVRLPRARCRAIGGSP